MDSVGFELKVSVDMKKRANMLMAVSAIDKVGKRYIELNLHSGYLVLCQQVIVIGDYRTLH